MSLKNSSVISIQDLTLEDIESVLRHTRLFKSIGENHGTFEDALNFRQSRCHRAIMLFAEASTRTRISFEMACQNLGMHSILFTDLKHSSMVKGETLAGTIATLEAFNPSILILRYKGGVPDFQFSKPIINAGFGSFEHPTQALVDAFTIQEKRNHIKGEKILIVGDVLHSRVSNSNALLLSRLGAKVAYCSPEALLPQGEYWKNIHHFKNLNDGVAWASVIMCLRVQRERHGSNIGLSLAEYRDRYLVGKKQLEIFNEKGVLLHPGPYISGVEIGPEILSDKRCHIMSQVKNGLYIRMSLMASILGLDIKTGS